HALWAAARPDRQPKGWTPTLSCVDFGFPSSIVACLDMGLTRFLVPRREFLPPEAAERAYLSGLDDIPWRTRVTATDDGLVAERAEHESGSFHVLWRVGNRGLYVLATATLMEREAAYNLPVELARGTINRL